jgi:acyl-[acyl-carrier-protein]-phospholipid O-acyltransferase/long-chain-fatty-acid--[acyl-carrier-protein] ligase
MHENYLLRPFLHGLFKLFYRLEVSGIEHYYAAGERCVIISNHQSYLDPLILATVLPQKPAFAINVFQADKWYFKWLDKVARLYKLDPSRPMVMKSLIHDLRKGCKVVIYPEGRITTSGGIMKVYEGTSKVLEKTGATILPVHIQGAEYSKLSRMGRFLRQRWFPRITVTILPPHAPVVEGETLPDNFIYDLMCEASFQASNYRRSILSAIMEGYEREGAKCVVASDISRVDLTYKKLFTRSFVLKRALSRLLGEQSHVGVLLPNSLAVMVTFLSLQMLKKIPCMLNFSAGETNMLHACKIAGVQTVLTSRVFIERANLQHVADALSKHHTLVYLEDVREQLTIGDKLFGALGAKRYSKSLAAVVRKTRPDDVAVVLYTSGSEGVPKGVALSHANLLSNIYQCFSRLDLRSNDIVFNALPTFHSFGMTIGLLMPMVRGLKTFLYPSPVHYRVIPELVYDTDATIMLGTDTFYRGYAHYANAYDFWNVRLAVAGAEKLKDVTRQLYKDRFDLTIFEGYGVTETSPVISFNTRMLNKHGTVGRTFPGMDVRLEPVEGLSEGGRLQIHGPNVMLGYLDPNQVGKVIPHGQWYDTGDIVSLDSEGYITIQGRAKRFAKIGGEMVSLTVVENLASALYLEAGHAAITQPDDKKGEQIILYTEEALLTREALIKQAAHAGVSELCVPRHVLHCEEIPRLGNGKIDYISLQKLHAQKATS